MLSKIVAVLSLITTVAAASGMVVNLLPVKYGAWIAVVTATISAFTKAVHDKGLDSAPSEPVVPTE